MGAPLLHSAAMDSGRSPAMESSVGHREASSARALKEGIESICADSTYRRRAQNSGIESTGPTKRCNSTRMDDSFSVPARTMSLKVK